ncbi:MAG TPA: tetratricopeptide repeat protein, partial [Candidatus Eisenbacteria bacterium]
RKAADTYERMVATDSTSAGAARLRWNLLRCAIQLQDIQKALKAVDGIVDHHPKTGFAEAALLQGANIAEANNLKPLALKYLGRYLVDYPNSAQAEKVRAKIRKLTQ